MNVRLALLAPVALALAGCGAIPLPARSLGDFELNLRGASANLDYVAYETGENRFASAGIPSFLSGVQLTGEAQYVGLGTADRFEVFVRPTDPTADPACLKFTDYIVCDAANEAGNRVGTVEFGPDRRAGVVLVGPSLDAAAKNARGFFGVRLRRGTAVGGDVVHLRGVKASARL